MTAKALQLKIEAPTGEVIPGRGFYQLEEETLYVQIAPFTPDYRFFSFLEADEVRLDLDKEGRLLFIEVDLPRRRWPVSDEITVPKKPKKADIRWLNFREQIKNPSISTNKKREIVKLKFSQKPAAASYYLAEDVILECDDKDRLINIYITQIEDDLAGQEIAAFRQNVAKKPPRYLQLRQMT